MAKVSAHGHEVGTINYLTKAKRYMSDGVILKNNGFGWKIHGKLKVGVDPREAFERMAERLRAKLTECPSNAAYLREPHSMAGLCKRWKLHAAVSLMPDDPDGVWSEACDGYGDNVSADVDEVGHLCMLYRAAVIESNRMKSESIDA